METMQPRLIERTGEWVILVRATCRGVTLWVERRRGEGWSDEQIVGGLVARLEGAFATDELDEHSRETLMALARRQAESLLAGGK